MKNKIFIIKKIKQQKDYNVSLNERDLYWIQTLLYDYIESSESNFHQKVGVLNTLMKTINVKKCHLSFDDEDMNNIKSLIENTRK